MWVRVSALSSSPLFTAPRFPRPPGPARRASAGCLHCGRPRGQCPAVPRDGGPGGRPRVLAPRVLAPRPRRPRGSQGWAAEAVALVVEGGQPLAQPLAHLPSAPFWKWLWWGEGKCRPCVWCGSRSSRALPLPGTRRAGRLAAPGALVTLRALRVRAGRVTRGQHPRGAAVAPQGPPSAAGGSPNAASRVF